MINFPPNYFCRKWNEFLRSDAALKCWSWARLKVDLFQNPYGYQDILKCNLISLVPELSIRMFEFAGKMGIAHRLLVKSILESICAGVFVHLKKLSIHGDTDWYGHLGFIDPGLLTSAVLKMQDCEIRGTSLTQRDAIITGLWESSNTSLKHLDLDLKGLKMPPDVVAGAAIKLETLNVFLSSPQLEAVLSSLATIQDSRLRNLFPGGPVNISSLAPGIVGQALTKLEQVGPELSLSLTADHLSALFTSIRQSPNLRLRQLYLSDKDLTLIPPEDLVGAIQRLEVAMFRYGEMTVEQLTTILTLAKEERLGRIRRIRIRYVGGMRSVSSALIHEATLNKLEWIPW